jgi:hypothetical protein
MYFDDDKCSKVMAGQTPATLKGNATLFTKESAPMVEKCSPMGTYSAMMTCHEGGIFKMNVYSDKDCKTLVKKEDLPK